MKQPIKPFAPLDNRRALVLVDYVDTAIQILRKGGYSDIEVGGVMLGRAAALLKMAQGKQAAVDLIKDTLKRLETSD